MEKGIRCAELLEETFYKKTYLQNQILGKALLESMRILDGKCIVSVVRKRDMDFFGVGPMDLEGIVSQLKLTEGVEVAIFMYQTGNLEYKVSLRSKESVDVSRIASYFGGGGHVRAAGVTMKGTFHDIINNLTLHIESQMAEQDLQ
jgi:phosphoesterase RecJ-like protein